MILSEYVNGNSRVSRPELFIGYRKYAKKQRFDGFRAYIGTAGLTAWFSIVASPPMTRKKVALLRSAIRLNTPVFTR